MKSAGEVGDTGVRTVVDKNAEAVIGANGSRKVSSKGTINGLMLNGVPEKLYCPLLCRL